MAAEAKTQPTDASVEDFLAAVDHPRRRAEGQTIHALLSEITGEKAVMWGGSIVGYGRYRGPTGYWPMIGFSPRKANLVLYIMGDFPEKQPLLGRLGPHKASVACVYITNLAKLDMAVVRELSERSLAAMRAKFPSA